MNGIDISLADPSRIQLQQQQQDLEGIRAGSVNDAEAADRFQTLLTTMLVKEMRSALPEGFFGGGPGAETFDSWLDDHLGKALADQDALGMAGMLKTSINRLERQANGEAAQPDAASTSAATGQAALTYAANGTTPVENDQ